MQCYIYVWFSIENSRFLVFQKPSGPIELVSIIRGNYSYQNFRAKLEPARVSPHLYTLKCIGPIAHFRSAPILLPWENIKITNSTRFLSTILRSLFSILSCIIVQFYKQRSIELCFARKFFFFSKLYNFYGCINWEAIVNTAMLTFSCWK